MLAHELAHVKRKVSTVTEFRWRKRVGVEPTNDIAKMSLTGFEDRDDHRTACASVRYLQSPKARRKGRRSGRPPRVLFQAQGVQDIQGKLAHEIVATSDSCL